MSGGKANSPRPASALPKSKPIANRYIKRSTSDAMSRQLNRERSDTPVFNERKVAQVAAYLLRKQSGQMSHLKLMKLFYLADRESLNRYNAPITFDCVVAMPHGPALSTTLNFMDGNIKSVGDGWESWVSDKANHQVALRKKDAVREDLDELSDADIDVLDAIWNKFGHMDQWALVDYTHDPKNCPEWQSPGRSSYRIPYFKIFRALGRSVEQAKELAMQLEEEQKLDKILASF